MHLNRKGAHVVPYFKGLPRQAGESCFRWTQTNVPCIKSWVLHFLKEKGYKAIPSGEEMFLAINT